MVLLDYSGGARGVLSEVSIHGTDLGKLIREDFWLIVTIME